MSEPTITEPTTPADGYERAARLRPHKWLTWVWAVPIAAALLVLWLAWRSLAERGPEIEISFKSAEGLQAQQSTVKHRDVVVGTVERLELSTDLSHVIVHVRMTQASDGFLNAGTQFYIVAPRVGAEGISGLSTLVSGAYIEMDPGKGGAAQRRFTGLDEPPVLRPDTPGTPYTIVASGLGSLTRGARISYHGISVGEVEGYSLDADGQRVQVKTFVRAPYDRLVHSETRFWNSGGVDLSVGTQGVRVRANSWQELLGGGIEFDTPVAALASTVSPAGSVFQIYDDKRSAQRDPRGLQLDYHVEFTGNLRGVDVGTAVELDGIPIGEIKATELKYDASHHTLITLLTLAIDAEKVHILDMPADVAPDAAADGDQRTLVTQWIEKLVVNGMRAQTVTANLVTGLKIISLDMVRNAPPARVEHDGQYLKIPSSSSEDLTAILQSLRDVLKNVDRATSGPELGHALKSLDATLTRFDQLSRDVEPDVKSLIKSLRDTADAAQATLTSVQHSLGSGGVNGADLPKLTRELTDAARSVRTLADYLDRHPEALLRGRKAGDE